LAILILAMVCLPFMAHGQTATILGTVTDPSGAVVPNVTITITHSETGRVTVFTSNDAGQYVAPDLPIGHYDVKAAVTGFKVAERVGLVLSQGDRARIDFQLQIGTTAQSVSVEANPVAVQTDTGAVSTLVTGQQVTELATNGRTVYTLVNLTTGASSLEPDFQTPTPVGGNANASFNGNRPAHNLYLMDGGEDDDRGGAGTFIVMPSMDAFAEVQTLTSNYDAQYGLSSGATFQTVLKSGTKTFHASAWEFLRNDALDARNFFNPAPATVAELRYNTYGFNVGGPVTFGHLYNPNKTKTFFFYNMEWRKLIQGGLLNQVEPATATYGGDFTGYVPANFLDSTKAPIPNSGFHVPCANQLTATEVGVYEANGITTFSTPDANGNCAVNTSTTAALNPVFAPWPGNTIPAALVSPDATALLKAGGKYGGIFPAPTGVNGSGAPAFIGGNNVPTDVREEIVRIDHNFSDKFTIFGHFVAEQISQGFGTSMWSGDNSPAVGTTFGNPSYSGVVHAAYTISPSLVNEIAFNYNGNRINILPTGLIGQPSGTTYDRYFTGPNIDDRIPNINLSGATGSNFNINWQPWVNKCDSYQIRDDVSWTKGRHQLKMGGSWELYKKIQNLFSGNLEGTYGFNGAFSGNDFADFLLGYAQSYAEDAVQDSGHWNAVSWATYIQDNYRVNNRLTLNLGLRWDGVPHTYEADDRMANFYPNLYTAAPASAIFATNPDGSLNYSNISPTAAGVGTSPNPIITVPLYLNGIGIAGQNGISNGLVKNHWAAFGPRLGFAYDLTGSGKTVIRGGYGLMYERVQGNDMYDAGGNQPFSATVGFNNVILGTPTTTVNGTPISVGIPVGSLTALNSAEYRLPTSSQFSLGIQHTIGKSVFSVSYVGTQNRHQSYDQEIDLPAESNLATVVANSGNYNSYLNYLGYRSILMEQDEANGEYNSIQMAMRGSIKKDLTYQLGYTYSRAYDINGGGSNGGDLTAISNPYAGWKYDWGPGDFDHRHIFFANYVYQIPLFKHSDNHLAKTLIGGWELSGITSAQTGAPINIGVSGSNLCSVLQQCSVRADLTGSISYPHTVSQWFSTSGFTAPATDAFGTLGHNALRGPGRDNWNMSLFKNFVFSESRGSMLQFRAEFFNIWNHTQFLGDTWDGNMGTNVGAGNFGEITTAADPRTIQLGLKLIF
jgi:hypothetical protein